MQWSGINIANQHQMIIQRKHMLKSIGYSITALLVCALLSVSCSKNTKDDRELSANESVQQETPKAPSIPDPRGSYSDSEGGLSFTFMSTGKFYQELLGETTFGTWSRSGSSATITLDDGSSMDVRLGDGWVEFNGMRLSK